jgi:dTDP-4-dehydrorhamnose reductase
LYFSNVEYINFNNSFFLNDIHGIKKKIKDLSPDIILNSAACTDLEFCEKKPDKTLYANVILPSILAAISSELRIRFIHISTDHLYKNIRSFKNENYLTSKVNNYGDQKIQAENLIIKNNPLALIIRTNFFSHAINSDQLIYKIINAIKKNEKITLFNDYFFTPIYSKYLAKIISFLIKKNYNGIFNVVSSERVSKYDFGKLLLKNPKEAKKFFIEDLSRISIFTKVTSSITDEIESRLPA